MAERQHQYRRVQRNVARVWVGKVGKAQTEGKNVARDGGKKEDRESKNGPKVSAQAPALPRKDWRSIKGQHGEQPG
jgi:hypothetical protein